MAIIDEMPEREKAEKTVRKILKRYFSILEKKEKPRFKSAELKEKTKEAFSLLKSCELCERKCKVNRIKGQKGFCQLTDKTLISSYFIHYGEEYFLVPSFTIFFWSCNFSCQFCQNWSISRRVEKPKEVEEKILALVIEKAAEKCRNVNFVGGEPTPQLPNILKTLSFLKADIPVVWNSNFYMSEKSMHLLKNVVDIYLTDFKYGNDKCAERLSKVSNYLDVVKRNHLLAAEDSEVVIRHLVLPSHVECCSKPALKWIAQNMKEKAVVNIMQQYRPEYLAYRYPDINRNLSEEEFISVIEHAKKLGLNFIY